MTEHSPAVPLLPYQKRWVRDHARFKIGLQARQTGKTFGTTLEIVDDCFDAFARGGRERWVILSRGERQAKEAIDEGIKRHARAYDIAFEESEYEWGEGDGPRYKALEVTLPGGSRITALPANPDTARGFSANVFLDEFAFHQDSRAIWGALFPVISKPGLKLRITSTPNGRNNKFFELWTAQDATWSRHKVTIYDAVKDGLNRNVAEMKAALADDELWAQEFECEFLDGSAAWLTHDLIAAAENEHAGVPENYSGNPCFVGIDIARRRDLFVIWVWERMPGGIFWTREVIARQNISFTEQDALLDSVMRRYRVVRVAMDQTGMGEKPVEDAKIRYGEGVVEGVILTGPRGLAIATSARQQFEDRAVRTPAGDLAIRSDFRQLQKIASATGAPRIVTPRDGGGHADRAWAAFLGLAAADNGIPAFTGYQSAGRGNPFDEAPRDRDHGFRMRADDADRRSGGPRFGRGAF
jgi:phage FluMu gp28-like protein